ncbi:hypothetical protein N1030_07180 [Desulfovibrio mangrovi]|uniref:phage regulatory CII family protein n=1 Tax=Desulfovibrio mangrovi TaxID=2976983 RepID=UPI0022463E68|nr:phage regulatory CII family protein [Desulfovibrio mangrovi]UZP68745.1 hypothetical protein N1030_07180 [Desulfovibrio mangrovi]
MATPCSNQENVRQSLVGLDAVDAFKLAWEIGNKPMPTVMSEMGWTESHARRVFSPERYFPTFEDLPRFCSVVGNTIIIQWLQVQAMYYGIAPKHVDVDCAELVKRMGELFGEMSDVGQEASAAIQDGKLEPKELRRIIRELNDVVDRSVALIGDLRVLERSMKEQGGSHG